MVYNHKAIEKKWQQRWRDNQTFRAKADPSKEKYYVLDMFPYPSGAGLHVGHVMGYTATDIVARYKRQCGYNVLHPMGWDSFGLPAEQYAIRTGTHPALTTKKNIDTYRRQLMALGFSYDWERELATSDPDYYKWTQWIFTQLYDKGLAYEAEMLVNYCPALGTVLSNEEIADGKAIEGGHPIERRPLRQWVLKITAYAERLLDDLDLLDWPDSLKKLQSNWIGKSTGAEVTFVVEDVDADISVFTTRADTLFGATYLVLAPEHPLVDCLTSDTQRQMVADYRKMAAAKSDITRTELAKEKTGVFTGSYAINPVNGDSLPIWIADYVLVTYGTGAVMAVPAHDERDFAFAKAHDLSIAVVYLPEEAGADQEKVLAGELCWPEAGRCINSDNGAGLLLNGLNVQAAKERIHGWLEAHRCGKRTTRYKLRDWLFSRQRYWGEPFPILHFDDGTQRVLDIDELPLLPPDVDDYMPAGDGQSPFAKVDDWMVTSDPKSGKRARRESNTMPQWAGSCWYYLRFCDPHNAAAAWDLAKEEAWMPVDLYIGGAEHAVLHLLYARFWHKVLYDCGHVSTPEPFQKLRNQGLVVARSYQDSDRRYISPADVEEKEGEYFERNSGQPLTSQIEKMSKSKLNGVTPDEIIEEFGADALRLYEMFMGPLEKEKVWNTDAVSGCRRFLVRFYQLVTSPKVSDADNPQAIKLAHRLVAGVTRDIEALQFNTAIAKMMEFLNTITPLDSYPRSVVKAAIQCLQPFAPHIAEELWEQSGFAEELSFHPYPPVDLTQLSDDTVTYVVQVNGKLRGRLELPKDRTQEEIFLLAKENASVSRHLDGKPIKKVIFVPNKLLNIVV